MACLHCPSVFQGLKGFLCHTLMFCLPRDATGRVAISGLFSQMAVDPGRGWFRPLGFCGDLAPLWAGRPDDRRGIPAGCREGSQGWPAHAGRPLECVNKQHPHHGRGAGNRGNRNHFKPAHLAFVPRTPDRGATSIFLQVQGCAEYRDPWLPSRHPAGMPRPQGRPFGVRRPGAALGRSA